MKRIIYALAALWPMAKMLKRTGSSPSKSAIHPAEREEASVLATVSNLQDAHRGRHVKGDFILCFLKHIAIKFANKCSFSDIYPLTKENLREARNLLYALRSRNSYVKAFTILFMCLIAAFEAPAQTGAAANTNSIQPLQIGDKIPEELWHLPLQVVNQPPAGGEETITLNDYRGKLIILDFWATWCGACIAAFPEIKSLMDENSERFQAIPITTQSLETVTSYVQRARPDRLPPFPAVFGDEVLTSSFPHRYLPHYVWIGKDGEVLAFTEFTALNQETLDLAWTSNVVNAPMVHDVDRIDIDYDRPLFENPAFRNSEPVYSSILWRGYAGSVRSGYNIKVDSWDNGTVAYGNKITVTNQPLVNLYIISHNEGFRRFDLVRNVEVHSKDQVSITTEKFGQEYQSWLADGNGYSYELVVPYESKDSLFSIMRQDLSRLFPHYKATVREEKQTAIELTVISPSLIPQASSTGEARIAVDDFTLNVSNSTLSRLVAELNRSGLFDLPITNQTKYWDKVDLQIKGDIRDLDVVNSQLSRYGLRLVDGFLVSRTLIISDNI